MTSRQAGRIGRRGWLRGLALVGLGAPAAPDAAAPLPALRLLTEEYPPLTYAEGGRATGLVTEIVRAMLQRAGAQATIDVVPWARGYDSAVKTPNVGLFATSRTPEREPLFKWIGPLAMARGALYARRTQPHPPRTRDEARRVASILVPREWYTHQLLRQEGFDNLYPVPDPGVALRMLVHGRADLAALDDVTVHGTAAREGLPGDAVVPVVPLIDVRQYLVFARSTDDAVVQALQRALDALRADGTVARLYRHWLPGVVPPE